MPGTETSFSCCWSHREGFCSPGTDISRRPGCESRWEPGSAGTGPRALPPCTSGQALLRLERAVRHLTVGMVLLQSTRAPGLNAARCASLGGSEPPWLGPRERSRRACIGCGVCSPGSRAGRDAPAGGCEVWPQHSRTGTCAVDFGCRKGGLRAGVLFFFPKIFV